MMKFGGGSIPEPPEQFIQLPPIDLPTETLPGDVSVAADPTNTSANRRRGNKATSGLTTSLKGAKTKRSLLGE